LTMDLDQNPGAALVASPSMLPIGYWIVPSSSLWREPLPLLIERVLKVWSGSWQRPRGSHGEQTAAATLLLSVSQGKHRFSEPLSFSEMTLIWFANL